MILCVDSIENLQIVELFLSEPGLGGESVDGFSLYVEFFISSESDVWVEISVLATKLGKAT